MEKKASQIARIKVCFASSIASVSPCTSLADGCYSS
jgi:hypothetical protein